MTTARAKPVLLCWQEAVKNVSMRFSGDDRWRHFRTLVLPCGSYGAFVPPGEAFGLTDAQLEEWKR